MEKQELHCHNCQNYVQFDIDLELNGNHVIICPKCKHEHCRVVEKGIITKDRWGQRNGNSNFVTYTVSNTTWTASSTWTTYQSSYSNSTSGDYYLYNKWLNWSS